MTEIKPHPSTLNHIKVDPDDQTQHSGRMRDLQYELYFDRRVINIHRVVMDYFEMKGAKVDSNELKLYIKNNISQILF